MKGRGERERGHPPRAGCLTEGMHGSAPSLCSVMHGVSEPGPWVQPGWARFQTMHV